MSSFVPRKIPNSAKVNYGFHWKLKGDRALILTDLESLMAIFDFDHLQRVQIGVKVEPKTQTLDKSCHCKNLSSSKCFKWHLYNYENNLWPKVQLNQSLFTGGIAHKNPKMDPNRSWTKKAYWFLLAKVKNDKYSKAETWHPKSIDGWSYYRLCENLWWPFDLWW